jgi:hypothetical protein
MQTAIQSFPALTLKVSIASGDARRFLVGDPEIQRIDPYSASKVLSLSFNTGL